jgi:signal transduction histidine kinase
MKARATGLHTSVVPDAIPPAGEAAAPEIGSTSPMNATRTARGSSWEATAALSTLSTLLDHIVQGILVCDRDGRILAFNRRYLDLFGYPPGVVRVGGTYEEILRFNVARDGYAGDALEAHVQERLHRVLTLTAELATDHINSDGRVISIRRTPVPGGGFINSYTEITKRWRIEQEAARTAALLTAVVDNMADGVRVFDSDLRLVTFNERAFRMLGYPMHLARVGTPYEDFARFSMQRGEFTNKDAGEVTERLSRARSGAKLTVEQTTRSGRIVRKQRNPMPGGGFVSTYTDVTDLKRAEQAVAAQAKELQTAMAELRRSNAELEQFAYVASHDLQEPLRMVASYCQLLQRRYAGKLDAGADEFIGFAVEGAERMRQLINDLLVYSRVGTKAKPFAEVAMEQVLEQALANLAVAIAESGARVTHDPLPAVFGDAVQLLQLLQNLVGNAIKFRGEAAPEVHVDALHRDDRWLIRVRDNGIGIEAPYLERIFLIFQRLHTRQQYPGTGIGLAVCKKIVDRHGGRIWVDSEPHKGSTFCFTLRGE